VKTDQGTSLAARQGTGLAVMTYGIWGFFPLFFSLLTSIPAMETLAQRIFWTTLFILSIVLASARRNRFWAIMKTPKNLTPYLLSSFFLAANWGLFIYGVNLGDVLQMSLAYFLNPLFNILFGVLFFKEKLGRLTKIAIVLAVLGVLNRSLSSAGIPVIAITIAFCFSVYGALRKRDKTDSITALTVESMVMLPFVIFMFFAFTTTSTLAFFGQNYYLAGLLILSGPVTGIPLITFSLAVQRIPYYLVGFIQYIAPTLMFLSAVLVFKEAWSSADLITFVLVWTGIILVVIEKVGATKPTETTASD